MAIVRNSEKFKRIFNYKESHREKKDLIPKIKQRKLKDIRVISNYYQKIFYNRSTNSAALCALQQMSFKHPFPSMLLI